MKNIFMTSSVFRSVLVIASVATLVHCAQVDGADPGVIADSGHRTANSGHDARGGNIEPVGGDGGAQNPNASDLAIALGEMYVGARHCAACHQSPDPADGILSGSLTPIPGSPSGVVGYGPNLTPDPDTGIGGWTDDQIIRAMRTGLDDQGGSLCVMPQFSAMDDVEASAIVAYLRSLPAVARTVADSTCPNDLMPTHDGGDAGGTTPMDAGISIVDPATPDADVPAAAIVDAGLPADAGVPASCTPILVINEVQSSGTGGAGDEFVEIYNDGDCGVSLSGYQLKYASATGTTSSRRWTGGPSDRIASRGYVLIAGMGFTGGATPIGWFATASGTLASTGGGIGLFDATGTQIDAVGYGSTATNPLVEGSPASAPAPGQSIARTPNGHDSNHNGTDFILASAPTPGAANH